jgi:predicted nucleotidyltransferase
MRRPSSLDPLLSRSVQEILSAILLEREEPWYLSDLAQRLGRTPSTLQRPLESLVRAGIIQRRMDGNRVYFARDAECPILPELQGLLAKTTGLADIVRDALRRFSRNIRAAFIFGSIAKGSERSSSDVDLFVIGDINLDELSPMLNGAETKLRRPINTTVLLPREFRAKLERHNHFLQSVRAGDKIFLVGTEHELEELGKPRTRRPARHKQIGTG